MNEFTKNFLLVSVGSPHGDDQIGWVIGDELYKRFNDFISHKKVTEPINLIHYLGNATQLHLVDACVSENSSQIIHRLEFPENTTRFLKAFATTGSHDFNLLQVLELANELGVLPESTVVWAIACEKFGKSDSISDELESRISDIVETIGKELNSARDVSCKIVD